MVSPRPKESTNSALTNSAHVGRTDTYAFSLHYLEFAFERSNFLHLGLSVILVGDIHHDKHYCSEDQQPVPYEQVAADELSVHYPAEYCSTHWRDLLIGVIALIV